MSSIDNVSATSHQIPAATTGKAHSAQKQEGQAALNSAETTQATQTSPSSGPKATGNNVDTTV